MKKRNSYLIIFFVVVFFLSCNNNESEINGNESADTTFSSKMWKNGDSKLRARMINSLIEKKLLFNLSRDSLFSLLGAPNESSIDFCNYIYSNTKNPEFNNYFLLHISFDTVSNRVSDYWITD